MLTTPTLNRPSERISRASLWGENGFSLVELIAVVAVLAVLVIFAVPIFNGIQAEAMGRANAVQPIRDALKFQEGARVMESDYAAGVALSVSEALIDNDPGTTAESAAKAFQALPTSIDLENQFAEMATQAIDKLDEAIAAYPKTGTKGFIASAALKVSLPNDARFNTEQGNVAVKAGEATSGPYGGSVPSDVGVCCTGR